MIVTCEELKVMNEILMKCIELYQKPNTSNCIPLPSSNRNEMTEKNIKPLEVEYNALLSYYNHICLRYWRSTSNKLNDSMIFHILQQKFYKDHIHLIELAKEYKCSSYKLSKAFLERLDRFQSPTESLDSCTCRSMTGSIGITEFLDNPMIVSDKWVRKQLLLGISEDLLCSPYQDQLKECVGKEYEALLIEKLQHRHMIFETEADLRNKGKAKTPDVLFLVPMMVQFQLRNSNHGTVLRDICSPAIHWIDSKAMFVDDIAFAEHREQFHSYIHRYGRGLVIYWFGFCETILDGIDQDTLVVCNHFPMDWKFPTGESADGRLPTFLSENINIESGDREILTNRVLFQDDSI